MNLLKKTPKTVFFLIFLCFFNIFLKKHENHTIKII